MWPDGTYSWEKFKRKRRRRKRRWRKRKVRPHLSRGNIEKELKLFRRKKHKLLVETIVQKKFMMKQEHKCFEKFQQDSGKMATAGNF